MIEDPIDVEILNLSSSDQNDAENNSISASDNMHPVEAEGEPR